MTAIVGILCADGLVIGTDSSVTFAAGQLRTIEQPIEKLYIVGDMIIVAGTGQHGLGQRFGRVVEIELGKSLFTKTNHVTYVGKRLAAAGIEDFTSTNAPKNAYGALVGFPLGDAPHICEFAVADFQPEFKDSKMWYVSMGSGQPITDPFLAFIRDVWITLEVLRVRRP